MVKIDTQKLRQELADFEAWAEAFADEMEEASVDTVRRLAFTFCARMLDETPFDKGRARAGWLAFLESGEATSEGLWSPGAQGEAAALVQGRSEGSYEASLRPPAPGVSITNAVPYIVPLEFGHSTQRPHGFVRIALREMQGREIDDILEDEVEEAIRDADRRVP